MRYQTKSQEWQLRLLSKKCYCYGYDKDKNGELVINKEQAEVVKLIFDLYLGGKSILGIVKELKERSIKSPA